MDSRKQMWSEIAQGAEGKSDGDASHKFILARGCDPKMAQDAQEMVGKHIGNANMVTATDDDVWIQLLD